MKNKTLAAKVNYSTSNYLYIEYNLMTITAARVCICVCTASGVPAVLIACTGFIDCERRYVAVTIISLASLINSCYGAGYLANHVDISPKSHLFCVYFLHFATV